MKGKKIGASRPGTDSDLAARVAIAKLGLAEKDVGVIAMGRIPSVWRRWVKGSLMPRW